MANEIKIPLWRGVSNIREGAIIHGFLIDDHTIRNTELGTDYRIVPESLAMSTGLTDKNGTEIFGSMPGTRGGDVVRIPFEQIDDWLTLAGEIEVKLPDGVYLITHYGTDLHCAHTELDWTEAEIIGNAFLQPELLEVAE